MAGRRGRIHVHERDTNTETPIIGQGLALIDEHNAAILDTEDMAMCDKTRKEYRNRIKRICKFWKEKYPDYHEKGTRVLLQEQKEDPALYHFNNEEDLVYDGLNVNMIKAYLSKKKMKRPDKDGVVKMASFSDIRKYDDAIKWGCLIANERLSPMYFIEMEKYLKSYRKEFAKAKSNGLVEERDADPISSGLFRLICQWAVDGSNVFVWVFGLCVWHCMARTISVDCLALHNIQRGTSDSIKIKHDETKTDKAGEFTHEKNCYANPYDPSVCLYTALGCWLSLNSAVLEKTEKLFILPGAKAGSASQRYCRQLAELVFRHADIAAQFIRLPRFNAHGIRKGSGTHSSSATTAPPSFVSVATRGDWSMGKILDTYFKFALGGDQYLGRVLALLDPNEATFSALPPHWKDPSHPSVKRGIGLTFHNILDHHGGTDHDPIGLLSLFLASMVHHSDWFLSIIASNPSHPFSNIPIFNEHELLNQLKEEATLKPTTHVPMATGIPPHISHAKALKEVFEMCTDTKEMLSQFKKELADCISEAVDSKVEAEGGVNGSILEKAMNNLKADLYVKLDAITVRVNNETRMAATTGIDQRVKIASMNSFGYLSRRWPVPQAFQFPEGTTIQMAWRKWLSGATMIVNNTRWKLLPYRELSQKTLHSMKLKQVFQGQWKAVCSVMERAPGLDLPDDTSQLKEDDIMTTFLIAMGYLKETFSYIFKDGGRVGEQEERTKTWAIGTWAKKLSRSEVMKHGSAEDRAKLPPATIRNQQHKTKRTFTCTTTRPRKTAKRGTSKRPGRVAVDRDMEEQVTTEYNEDNSIKWL